MAKSLFIGNYFINNVDDFESWLKEECNFYNFECEILYDMYDEELQASQYAASYADSQSEFNWYQDHVSNIRNEIMYIVEDMQERLTGKESRQQLTCIQDLLGEL